MFRRTQDSPYEYGMQIFGKTGSWILINKRCEPVTPIFFDKLTLKQYRFKIANPA
jgi:hypothetical protein